MSDLIQRAEAYATQAHERIDHRRKYNKLPYQEHLRTFAALVAEFTDDPETIAAAWLHDTLEDTPATSGQIEQEFGFAVAKLVEELTDVSKPGDGNRAVRKQIDRDHLGAASARAQTVKLADLIDNCEDITGHDTRFAKVYLEEMAVLLEVLERGDKKLRERAYRTHAECMAKLRYARRRPSGLATTTLVGNFQETVRTPVHGSIQRSGYRRNPCFPSIARRLGLRSKRCSPSDE